MAGSSAGFVLLALVAGAAGAAGYQYVIAPRLARSAATSASEVPPGAPLPADPAEAPAAPLPPPPPAPVAPQPVPVPVPPAPAEVIGEVSEVRFDGDRPSLRIVGTPRPAPDASADELAARETARRLAELDEMKQIADRSYEAARQLNERDREGASAARARTGGLTMFSATWCGPCKRAQAWLAQNGVRYQNRDVDQGDNKAALRRFNPRGGIPTFVLGDQVLVGWSEGRLAEALERAGLWRRR